MTKRVIIVHRWDGEPDGDWYPWLREELEAKGFKVTVPAMPDTSEPKIDAWVSHLKKIVGQPDEDTYFIGHSIGCQTIMRYLETSNAKIGGMIFVAGWLFLRNLENVEVEEIARPWLTTPINFPRVKERTNKITVFLSSNDPFDCSRENEIDFKETLGARVFMEVNMGHFTGDDGVSKIPVVLKELLRMAEKK